MEKRVLLAALLSAIFLSWYSQSILKRPAHSRPAPPSAASENTAVLASPKKPAAQHLIDEEAVFIASEAIQLELGTSSGSVRSATLMKFLNESKTAALRFSGAPNP